MSFENAVYAVVAIPRNLSLQTGAEEFNFKLQTGVNGTCFFISHNQFVTAHHILNRELFDRQDYFLVNSYNKIIHGVSIERSDPNMDLTIGRVISPVNDFVEPPIQFGNCGTGQVLQAIGYSQSSTKDLVGKCKRVNNGLEIVELPVTAETVVCKYIDQTMVIEHSTVDGDVVLRNCTIWILDRPLARGFSGCPIIDLSTSRVVAFASQQAQLQNATPVQLAIPISGS